MNEFTVYGSNGWSSLKPIDLSKIVKIDFPDDQYYQEIYDKKQVVLHHTVSGPGIRGDVQTWLNNTSRIATCIIVDREGVAHQAFSSKFFGHHIGIKSAILKELGFSDYRSRNLELKRSGTLIESILC